MKLKALMAIMVGLGMAAAGAAASPVTWTIQNANALSPFSGSVTGGFSFDGSNISSWTIAMPSNSYSSENFPAETLTAGNSSQSGNGAAFTVFESNDGNFLFYIVNAFDPGTAGTVSGEELIEQYQASPNNYFEVIFEGNLVGTDTTPEPATWALLGTGMLGLLGLGVRMRRQAQVPA